ncbi:dihydropteroate synthase [Glacieibacterium sp.]|uniref:dihydropteroate synthase n=1 Tax=Glacieibacterium sp. TaxID=2860237 RepID=UPI003B001882
MPPGVMGILNLTPDSFSDGGRHADPDTAFAAARAMIDAGAALVDIGGESTRPRAPLIPEAEELARVGPLLDRLRGSGIPFSIDTRKAAVMARALDAGAVLVNDVSALTFDPGALALVARRDCPVVLMHAQGTPQTMQDAPRYDDVLAEVHDWLAARIEACVAAGVARERITVDPGIGFGKTLEHNLTLLRGLARLGDLGCPVLLGVSRKKMIGTLTGAALPDRLPGSLALALHGAGQGVSMVRVHDVPETVQALRMWAALTP